MILRGRQNDMLSGSSYCGAVYIQVKDDLSPLVQSVSISIFRFLRSEELIRNFLKFRDLNSIPSRGSGVHTDCIILYTEGEEVCNTE